MRLICRLRVKTLPKRTAIDRLIGAAEGWRDKYVVELVFGATARPALANCVAPNAATRKTDRRFDGWHFMSDRLKYWGELGDRRL